MLYKVPTSIHWNFWSIYNATTHIPGTHYTYVLLLTPSLSWGLNYVETHKQIQFRGRQFQK